MFHNYFISAFRYFLSNRGFALLSIIGLSLGIACSQQANLYQELTGEYEYLMEGQYIPAKVFIQNDTLMCDVGVGIVLNLEPVNAEAYTFRSENEGSVFDIRFEKNENGDIVRFIFKAGDVMIPVERLILEPDDGLFAIEEIKDDYHQLKEKIENTHPALYAFTDRVEFDAFLEKQYSLIDREMTVEEVYPIFAAITAKIGCGHSVAMMPVGYWENLEGKLFPLHLKFIGDSAYVRGTFSRVDSLQKGSMIHTINGRSMDEILPEMRELISTDAFSHNYQNFRLGKRFSFLYAILFGHPDSFVIGFSEPGKSETNEISVQPVSVHNMPKEMSDHHGLGIDILHDKKVAILTVSHFAFYDNREFFYDYIDKAFSEISNNNIEKLILDVRGNTGGDPFCAAHLLSYLEKEPVVYFSKPFGEYIKLTQPVALHENHYKGKLIVLIDGGGLSTTGHFLSLLKYHRIGILIGEESGATYTCNDASRSYQLKNTRIQGHIASRTFSTAVNGLPKNRGILPDHHVVLTPEDLKKGVDTVMEYALNLLK
jgi:hypothetical protein